jgi:ADP-ribosylglycohydrolase
MSGVLPPAMPFSLNQPAHAFDIGPTDDAEWAAYTAGILLRDGVGFETARLDAWLALARLGGAVKGGVGVQAALRNLRRDIGPPRSGRENPHYFDDGAIARAVPIGVFHAGDPENAAETAGLDASVTNAEDGVWAAQAMAAAVSLACAGKPPDEFLEASIRCLPADSLTWSRVGEALSLVKHAESIFPVLPELQNRVLNREYSYGNAAPETLALAFAIIKLEGRDFERAVTVASSIGKAADSLPAVVGALAGAMSAGTIASDSWLASISRLKGICIPALAGANYLELTDRLVDHAMRNHDTRK